MQSFIMGALLCALAAEPTQDKSSTQNTANRAADSAQEGSRGSGAVGESRTGPPAAGIEYGEANGLAGGRTDRGPRGETGIRGDTPRHEKARSRANSQARRPNRKGSLQRPAETPPQRNDNPKVMGSGAPMTPVRAEPQPQGRNYVEGPQPGAAGGVASGSEGEPGAASPRGTAGKGAQTQPDKKPSSSPGGDQR